LVLFPIGLQSVIFSTSFITSILLRCPHYFTLCASMYLTVSFPFIKFCNSLTLLFLHLSLYWIGPNIPVHICLSKTNKLLRSRTDNIEVLHM
jgi:hypothetical protein